MMRTLVENPDLLARCRQSVYVWQNVVHFLFFVEEFMFTLPPVEEGRKAPLLPLQVVHDTRGVWRAYSIAQKLLEFLDAFVQIKFSNPFELDEKSKEIMEVRFSVPTFALFRYSLADFQSLPETGRPSTQVSTSTRTVQYSRIRLAQERAASEVPQGQLLRHQGRCREQLQELPCHPKQSCAVFAQEDATMGLANVGCGYYVPEEPEAREGHLHRREVAQSSSVLAVVCA
jgi:hypothetical protein